MVTINRALARQEYKEKERARILKFFQEFNIQFVARFDSGEIYHDGYITIRKGQCSVCGNTERALQIDAGGDYHSGRICKKCIDVAFMEEDSDKT